jgi:pimeloyl-ACP methyl ester carboxylesterase
MNSRNLYAEVKGSGQPVVFLHGMASSHRYWAQIVNKLDGYETITLDLLGFGHSPMPKDSDYTYGEHIEAIVKSLKNLDLKQPIILVGHSMGALIALRLAANKKLNIKKLVLVGLPIFKDFAEAQQDITHGRLSLRLAYYGPTSYLLCNTWCKNLRFISKRLAPHYLKYLPKAVAEDSVLHTWHAYNQTRHHILEHQNVVVDLAKLDIPVVLVYGSNEKDYTQILPSASLERKNIKVIKLEGTHHLPIEQPEALARLIT